MAYHVHTAQGVRVPVLVSSPHSGTDFPVDLTPAPLAPWINTPVDTDWHIPRLYDFVMDLGIDLIEARYSRYVIDLNRDPSGASLYRDGRSETELVPTKTFALDSLYGGVPPSSAEIERRKKNYFEPYHLEISRRLRALRDRFGVALLFDAHSIREFVPSIRSEVFPHFIFGNQRGRTCPSLVIESAAEGLRAGLPSSPSNGSDLWTIRLNDPFQGGYLTRNQAQPEQGIFTLQLEMRQSNYMDEESFVYRPEKAEAVRSGLRRMFEALIRSLELYRGDRK